MIKTNVVVLTTRVRLKYFVYKLNIEEFSNLLYGFVRLDDHLYKKRELALTNFDAFLSDIGPLARADFYNALEPVTKPLLKSRKGNYLSINQKNWGSSSGLISVRGNKS